MIFVLFFAIYNDLSESIYRLTCLHKPQLSKPLIKWLRFVIGSLAAEQKGSDRARYGDRLLKRLEERVNTKGLNETLFRNSRTFYNLYPQIAELFKKGATASHKLIAEIHPTASDELKNNQMEIHPTLSDEFATPPKMIIERLPFSHLCEIMTQKDPPARFFYETECIKGTWSVKELRRQIATNLYFRSGVSKDPKKLLASIQPEANTAEAHDYR